MAKAIPGSLCMDCMVPRARGVILASGPSKIAWAAVTWFARVVPTVGVRVIPTVRVMVASRPSEVDWVGRDVNCACRAEARRHSRVAAEQDRVKQS